MENREREKRIQEEGRKSVKAIFAIFIKLLTVALNIILTLLLVVAIAGVIVVCAFAIYLSDNVETDVDDIITLSSDQDSITAIYYYNEEGELVEDISQRLSSGKNKLWVSYYDIPENLSNAFVAIEDKRFWDHHGVDWITTVKATMKFFIPVGSNPGGSTITQQLIKNLTGEDDYSIQRKVTEIFRAMALEDTKSKPQILEMYLNTIYLSQGAYGVQAAANVYFSKDVSELTLLECAAIAGITQSPTKWDPLQNPENNKERRNTILAEMLSQGMITQSEFDEAYDAELELHLSYESIGLGTTSWYTDAVISDAIKLIQENYNVSYEIAKQMLYSGGYHIVTAMDPEIQSILEKYYEDVSKTSVLPVTDVVMPESAMVVADPETGNILGLVGGRGEKSQSRIFNRATMAKRQAGSSFKPIAVYAPAMDLGILHAGSVLEDVPFNFGVATVDSKGKVSYSKPSGWPQNVNRSFAGRTTLKNAIEVSKNTTAIHVLSMLTLDRSYEFLTGKLRMESLIETAEKYGGVSPDLNYAALGLGGLTHGVTVREMVAAYTMFPTGGVFTNLRTVIQILDSDGKVIIDNPIDKEVVISEGTAQAMTKLLERVVTSSSGSAYSYMKGIRSIVDVAGKTGTTDSNNDRWFVGYTPYYVAGVWLGYDEPQSLSPVVKRSENCVIWNDIMVEIHEIKVLQDVKEGKTTLKTFDDNLLIEATYCKDSGQLITDTCNKDPRGNRSDTAYFTKDTLPTKACEVHVLVAYCRDGKGVANSRCPNVTYVALMNVTRVFQRDIYITDAQYTWRRLPGSTSPYRGSSKYPFYYGIYESGTYPGRTNTSSQYNRACPLH